jgi:TRAP-type C4-dicarboxylate transport system permease small subunit
MRFPEISDEVKMSKLTSQPVFTFEDLRVSALVKPLADEQRLSLSARIMSTVSLVVCFIIIVVTAWIYFTPTARHHLDRISFRLLLCVMVLEIGYDSAWIALFHAVRQRTWN